LSRAINHITDISEILAYEKQSFKLNSQVAFVITSPEAGSIGIGSKRVKQDLNDLGNISVDNLYNSSGIPQLKPGEDIKSFANDHPNSNFETFLNYLMRDIAWGMGIAPELLWDISSAGGANTRYLLEDANQFFAEIQSVTREQFCRPFWTFWIWNEIESGRLEHPGDDWWRVHFIAPKPPSVDLGREGKLYIDLVNSGLMSRKRYFGMLGLDADDEIDDLIADAVAIKEKCEKAGIKKTDIIPPAPGSGMPHEYEDEKSDDDSPGEDEESATPVPNLTKGKQA
jgi:capsid protein